MNFASEMYLRSLMSMSREQIGQRMITAELAQGFEIVREADWLQWDDWSDYSIFSKDHDRIRLVAIEAKRPGKGAFTRLIAGIVDRHLVPVLVEPNRTLIDWCLRHDYRSRRIGKGSFTHEVWYPRG
jgi:hypothetical protein